MPFQIEPSALRMIEASMGRASALLALEGVLTDGQVVQFFYAPPEGNRSKLLAVCRVVSSRGHYRDNKIALYDVLLAEVLWVGPHPNVSGKGLGVIRVANSRLAGWRPGDLLERHPQGGWVSR